MLNRVGLTRYVMWFWEVSFTEKVLRWPCPLSPHMQLLRWLCTEPIRHPQSGQEMSVNFFRVVNDVEVTKRAIKPCNLDTQESEAGG